MPKKKLSAVSLLPDGSQLHGVMFPRYDDRQRLIGVLKAGAMTLVNDTTISGQTIAIEFYNPDQSPRGRVDLKSAIFNQSKGTLEANESVIIRTDQINANGNGLIYDFEQAEGFLLGPVTTWIQADSIKPTSMKPKPSALGATAAIGIALLPQTLTAAPPPPPTAQEQAAFQEAASSQAAKHADAAKSARADLRADLDASAAATAAAKAFLEKTDGTAEPTPVPPPADAKPLDVKPGPTDSVVNCDGGMYFDADEGVFVFLKNVRVNDPRFSLTGASEVKIFLAKKPEGAPDKKDKSGLGLSGKFGDVERVVANGAVLLTQKETEKGKDPVQASGAIFSYRPQSGEIILSGGYPWVKQGSYYSRAKEPNLTLRMFKNGSFVTEGNWELGGNIEQKP